MLLLQPPEWIQTIRQSDSGFRIIFMSSGLDRGNGFGATLCNNPKWSPLNIEKSTKASAVKGQDTIWKKKLSKSLSYIM